MGSEGDSKPPQGVPGWVGPLCISLVSVLAGGLITAAIGKFSSAGNDVSTLKQDLVAIKTGQTAFKEMFMQFCRQMEQAQTEKKATDEWQTKQIYKLLNHANLSP
jgi:16S rRNA G1207 methylase RsmC